tara:strand:+ start:30140 stop:30658 length:519 start_codon:yes stop_codon:yes gene_type:complete
MEQKKIPIKRLNKFFSQEDFNLNIDMGKEYVDGDLNFTLVLFRVDKEKSDIDAVYAEAGPEEIRYFPPVEFKVGSMKIDTPKNSSYADGLVEYKESGNLTFGVYDKHLKELSIDISYGDYIGYPEKEDRMRYFVVADAGKVQNDNAHTMGGYKAFFRSIICTPVTENEFKGI